MTNTERIAASNLPLVPDDQLMVVAEQQIDWIAEKLQNNRAVGRLALMSVLVGLRDEMQAAFDDRLAAVERERDELRAELRGALSEAFQAIPVCYDTPTDHYREMARRLVEDRDVQKHKARKAEAALAEMIQQQGFGSKVSAEYPNKAAKWANEPAGSEHPSAQSAALAAMTRERAALVEAPASFTCKAQRTADPPQDCDWPSCGCDPYADKVLAALEEAAPGLFTIMRDNEELRAEVARLKATPPAPPKVDF